ncbi:gluconate 2-dehydrogenase subunit 3 family protein [Pedobacter boryungensis]|uniref:Gluconate 2-dehydrogenase subunit 3 family protein n=1 Tax=Pedobacter boryungensis TaxID=869962 RepID=A0ABX2DEX0_9SPHI|nr:gluconate 2-dehydrogenase subunit 3 family protein [Pedobacter boryungensis]NQX32530.1 gluconate 2-dehydrogenase subunit 3 family protein [Pedobacter boryungensis]
MDRREAVKSVAFLIGGALSATTIATLFDSCNEPGKNSENLFTSDQEKLISEIADIIIPTTAKSPGAKAANVGPFISMMIKECYPEDAQKAFVKGLENIETRSKKDFGKSFLEISVKEREQLITKVRDETVAAQKVESDANEKAMKLEMDIERNKPEKERANPTAVKDPQKTTPQFFAIARDLTMLGYFTSEVGATQAYEYVQIPGRYDGCVDLKPGQRVWA